VLRTLRLPIPAFSPLLSFFMLLVGQFAFGAALPTSFSEQQVASGLSSPTAMTEAPDGRIFVCEQGGRLRVIKNDALLSAPFVSLTVSSSGERGLLGVTFDPNFSSNHFVYVYYTTPTPAPHNRVSRFTSNGDVAVAGSEVVLFELENLSSATNHNGGALHFGPDGLLYIAVGENANASNAQTLSNKLGKILRINKDGSIPTSNPFFGSTTGSNRAIWALGLRNPFTFAFRPGSGELFINDVGQSTWEEINLGQGGANYGWPTTEGPTSDARFVSPLFSYGHGSSNTTGCAISGGAFYNPSTQQFPTSYLGTYFFADYCSGWVRKLDTVSNAVSGFATGISSPVDLLVSTSGFLYYLARGNGTNTGVVYKISYAASQPPAITQQPANRTVAAGQSVTFTVAATGTHPLWYQWLRNGAIISGATSSSYTLPSAQTSDNGTLFRCKISNSFGNLTSNNAQLTVSANAVPVPNIISPASGLLYVAGSIINYAGTGTDTEDGTLPASAFTWQVDFHHDTHVHPFIAARGGAKTGSFMIPNTGETSANVWYRIYLTVKDSAGVTKTAIRDIAPQTSMITLRTLPAGLSANLDGQPRSTPYSVVSVVGMLRSIGAPNPQARDKATYEFAFWSDGGNATHTVATDPASVTYTAVYRVSTLSPLADSYVRDGSFAGTNFGSSPTLNTKVDPATGYTRWTYLKFDLNPIGSLSGATLRLAGRLSGSTGSNFPTAVYSVSNTSWTEGGINWTNRPASSSTALASVTVTDNALRSYNWNVGDFARNEKGAGRNVIAFALKNTVASYPFTIWNSREASASRPLLLLQGFTARVNFQPTFSAIPADYVADTGATYANRSNGFIYGWNANIAANAIDRNNTSDQRIETLIQAQAGGSFTWEIAVPNGKYAVHVVAGDPSATNSVYRFNVEGVLVVNGAPTASRKWIDGTTVVTVTDGRLTLTNASGASNNKICYIDITAAAF
jgi:glucose/arabinose dehydrogenase